MRCLEDPNAKASAAAIAAAPVNCPVGFAEATGSSLIHSGPTAEVAPGRIGLGALRSLIACAVIDRSADPFALVVMRADVTEEQVRYALFDLEFDEGRFGYAATKRSPGEVDSFYMQTYGSLAKNLTDNNRVFARFRRTFPPLTVVVGASLKGSRKTKSKPATEPKVPLLGDGENATSGPSWYCSYSPTMNNNWHDDVLCTNGAQSDRPYLLPNDSYIRQDEIVQAAQVYQQYLNGN